MHSRANVSSIFEVIGVIPFIVLFFIVFFGVMEPRFVSGDNLFNLSRQSSYLILVCLAQLIVLLTGGIDLSVGSAVSLASVVCATAIKAMTAAYPEAEGLAVSVGLVVGVGTGGLVGLVNGVGVAYFKVTPFVMTLGSLSMALGLALFVSGGYSIAGLPTAFGDLFSYADLFGVPVAILYTIVIMLLVWVLLSWTRAGRYLYSIGSNLQAARLSGIPTRRYTLLAYVVSGLIVGFAAVLMTARTESGEANLGGADLVLKAIAGCIIGGVALTGGKGLVRNVVLGAFFITLLSNGMNLLRVNSYLQTFIMGAVLVLAIAIDQIREHYTGRKSA
ncbi:ABC transporter permease [Limibacillus halophilus]|uniref:Ribose transport system permease protein n=1 Tax=Limibacillus halophilus TaxID=1579333 RepID=A0A839SQJ1_9PROT|nr:ABC transporter permease [Limibacillus halophilus]MBB3064508.1 ribose transport system permease protein [Limibacillus halophilus]